MCRHAAGANVARSLTVLGNLYKPEPKGWNELPKDAQDVFVRETQDQAKLHRTAPLGRRAWNVLREKDRQKLLKNARMASSPELKGNLLDLAEAFAGNAAEKQISFVNSKFFCDLLTLKPDVKDKEYHELLKSDELYAYAIENHMDNSHLAFLYASEFQLESLRLRAKKRSSATAFDMNNMSVPSTVNILTVPKLHTSNVNYDMFWGLDSQKFLRFDLPCTLDSLFLGDETKRALTNIALETAKMVEGMPIVLAGTLEPETQAGFQCMLRKVVKDLRATVLDNKQIYVQPTNGMQPVEFKQEIRQDYYYLKKHAEKETRSKKKSEKTSRMKTVSVEGDLALWEANEEFVLGERSAGKKKEIFLRSKLNIEMKRCGLLSSQLNRSELSQLGLQSLARSKGRAQVANQHKSKFEPEAEVFSLLTDGTTLYILRHDVKNGKYWMSRGITNAFKQAVALCWLVLATHGQPGTAASFDENWETEILADTLSDPDDLPVQLATDGNYQGKSRTRLPNGRSLEEQEQLDKLAYRFCENMARHDATAFLVPSSNSLSLQMQIADCRL